MSAPRQAPTANDAEVPERAGLARAAAAGSGWTSGQAMVNKLATAVGIWIIARHLSEDEFGMASLTFAIAGFMVIFPPMVMGDVLITYQRHLDRVSREGLRLALVTSGAATLAMCALAPFIAAFYSNYPAGTLTGLVMAISLRATADASGIVPLSRLRGALLYRSIALIDGTAQLAATLATVVLALNGAGAMSLVLPQVLAAVAKAMAYAWACTRGVQRNPRHRTRSRLYPRIRADFFTASVAQYVHNAAMALPPLLLARLSTETETGIFGFSFMLATQVTVLIAYQLGLVLQPIFVKMRDDPPRQAAAYLRVLRVIGTIAVPLSLLQAALAEPMFALLFPGKWDAALPVFAVMSVVQCFYFGVTPGISMLKAQARFGAYFAWQAAHVVIALVAYAVAATYGGALAVAVTDTGIWAVSVPFATWLATRGSGRSAVEAITVFTAPWVTAAPVALLAWLAWKGLAPYGVAGQVISLAVVGPIAFAMSMGVIRWTQPATYAELRSLAGFRKVRDAAGRALGRIVRRG
jgi:O-antigen/teichoic acid export membrane protein